MVLSEGDTLGSYQILEPLGAGGMGEVYRATDTRLDREVAIKVLPAEVSGDPERLARFRREAHLLASLNHPNIGAIHGLEEADGHPFLVLELVEGEDLKQRLDRGAIPLDEALEIARQISEALEEAHAHGIVHRDLKPANVKITQEGKVKVLDFGLAKAWSADGTSGSAVDLSASPTLARSGTQAGVILGTAAYMAPEQAKGRAVDQRADIWAFGCVLFEMLAARAAFTGETVTEVLARVIERDPDWAALPGATPVAVRRLLRRCLEKNPRRRLAAIADARLELDETTAAATDTAAAAPRTTRILFAAIGLLAVAAVVATYGWIRAARSAPPLTKATYVAATLATDYVDLAALADRFAVSPDGTRLALVGRARGLLLRRTSGLEIAPITGAPPGAFSPVFSPDGEWIAFSTGHALMKIPTEGGPPTVLVAGSDSFINLTWSADGRIRYPSLHHAVLRSVSSGGGPVETVSFGPSAYVSRAVGLPNGRLLVSLMTDGECRIVVREPDGTLRKLLDGWDARLAPTGHLLFSRQDGTTWSVVAAPFDVSTARVTGEAAVLAQDVPVRYATPAGADAAGDLFYIGGTLRSDRRVVLLDRAGAERDLAAPAGAWVEQHLSPDGRRLALTRFEGARRTLWTLTLATGALTQVTYLDDTFDARWTPDGRQLVFTSYPIDPSLRATTLWSVLTDGRGKVEPIAAQWDAYPGAVSSDGRVLYYGAYQGDQGDLASVALDGAAPKPTVLLATPASEELPRPSPDGRWLAYQTNASGTDETRVAPLADPAAAVQVSTRGGWPIRWSPDGTRLYYTDGDTIASVDVGPGGPVLASRRAIFSVPGHWIFGVDVMPDGNHAVTIRGGLIYSDIVVVQHALSPAR